MLLVRRTRRACRRKRPEPPIPCRVLKGLKTAGAVFLADWGRDWWLKAHFLAPCRVPAHRVHDNTLRVALESFLVLRSCYLYSKASGAFSRTSVGLDLTAAMLGSEGCLGIITSVVVKVVPLPAVSKHASFLFRDFQVVWNLPKRVSEPFWNVLFVFRGSYRDERVVESAVYDFAPQAC